MRTRRLFLAAAAAVALGVAARPVPARADLFGDLFGSLKGSSGIIALLEAIVTALGGSEAAPMAPLPPGANGDVLAGTQQPVGEAPDSYVLHTGPQKFDKLYPVPPDPETFSPDGASRSVWTLEAATRLRAAETTDTGAAAFADDQAATQRLNDIATENALEVDTLARKLGLNTQAVLDAALTAHKTSTMTAQVLQLMGDRAEKDDYAKRWQDAYAHQVLANGYWTGVKMWAPDNVGAGY